ncbi:MAG TPA: bifunctional riboflavin kinase/FAD synthetase, partial [Lactococcus sp.]|nr:bifunctional riboflavin kinase/FAD synthetase [Lactococcus sp.]
DMTQLKGNDQYKVVVVPEVSDEKGKISSTRIRELVKTGDIASANALLGYPYEITGIVVHGFARGRTIGYPTANLAIKDFIHIPSPGVYTVDVLLQGERQRGFASIGYNETFNGKEKTVEIHIFDKDLDLYGEKLTVLWLDKIRDMIKFESVDALIAQMKEEEKKARQYQEK